MTELPQPRAGAPSRRSALSHAAPPLVGVVYVIRSTRRAEVKDGTRPVASPARALSWFARLVALTYEQASNAPVDHCRRSHRAGRACSPGQQLPGQCRKRRWAGTRRVPPRRGSGHARSPSQPAARSRSGRQAVGVIMPAGAPVRRSVRRGERRIGPPIGSGYDVRTQAWRRRPKPLRRSTERTRIPTLRRRRRIRGNGLAWPRRHRRLAVVGMSLAPCAHASERSGRAFGGRAQPNDRVFACE